MKFDRSKFFAAMRSGLGRLNADQVRGAETLLGSIEADPLVPSVQVAAYMLATAWHETAQTMRPIVEMGGRSYFDKYDPVLAPTPRLRERAISMGNAVRGDGFKYRGRGYVQTTWLKNYRRLGLAAGVDLVADPDRALEPEIAYLALSRGIAEGWYTGRKIGEFIRPGRDPDYASARRTINGTDCAETIAAYARRFEAALTASLLPA